jgi:hypothetical protein
VISVRSCLTGLALAAMVAPPPAAPVLAEVNIPEIGEVDQCLPLTRIKRTKAVSNQTIVVEMKSSDGWRKMETQNRCPGLKIEDGFSYATPLTQLCKGDIITVLGGIGSRCGLAQITVISEEDAKSLIAKR